MRLFVLGGLTCCGLVVLILMFACSWTERRVGEALLGDHLQGAEILETLIRENRKHYAFACLDDVEVPLEAVISVLPLPIEQWAVRPPTDDIPATIFYAPATGPTAAEVFTFNRREVDDIICLVPTGRNTPKRPR